MYLRVQWNKPSMPTYLMVECEGYSITYNEDENSPSAQLDVHGRSTEGRHPALRKLTIDGDTVVYVMNDDGKTIDRLVV